jgi:SPP1 family predicted phage head-tail adaptor
MQPIFEQDDIGNQIELSSDNDLRRQTFAEKRSIRQSEYYQAAVTGLKPEIVFVIWALEYKGEPKVEYNGKTYTVIRTYEKFDKTIELYCEVKVGG